MQVAHMADTPDMGDAQRPELLDDERRAMHRGLEACRVAQLRLVLAIGELGVALDRIEDRLDGRPPRKGTTRWRTFAVPVRALYAAAKVDFEENGTRWTDAINERAMQPRVKEKTR
jgi:hypothetical protein